MSNRMPLVSIILPCRNEKDHIIHCLGSILRQEAPAGGFEVIVADGMSDDGTREILKQLAEKEHLLQVVDNPAYIVSTGLNVALHVAKGQIIMRMDAHTEYAPDYVRQCVAVLDNTHADNVGGPWVARGNGPLGRAIAAAFQSRFAVGGAKGHDAGYEGVLDTVYLGCWPREVFGRIGLFDEELVRNQDDEFNLRLTRAGGKIWQSPRIRSWYSPRGSLRDLFQQYMQYGYWKVRVIQKHHLPASIRHLVPGAFVLLIAVLPLLSLWLPFAGWCWLGLVGAYLLCNLAASFHTATCKGWSLLRFLPAVYASYHFAFGLGFLRGILDFVLLRRGQRPRYVKLTRTPTGSRNAMPSNKIGF